jgi:hypothetical protein
MSLFTEFIKIVQNEALQLKCTIHSAVIPIYKATGWFECEHSRLYEKMFWTDVTYGTLCIMKRHMRHF